MPDAQTNPKGIGNGIMKKLLFFVLCACVLSSCVTNHNITLSQARLVESNYSVITAPVIGELDATSISPTRVCDSVDFDISGVKNAKKEIEPFLDDYKHYVVANCCQKNNYDVMINPLYQITTNAEGNVMKVVVTGFPAKYKSFRQATENDKWMSEFIRDFEKNERIKEAIQELEIVPVNGIIRKK